jgi:UDP-N-acetylglucosamine--N-acetylmuramyl-(pentapeptide) pyrophosphoryl-undecaprenol N-acetylglucosamine transferase
MFIIDRPKFVIGAGGYVCGPTLMSAWILGVPVFIIEQNAVMGLTNKLLSKIAKRIFVNFKETKGLENTKKVIKSGNPINNKIEFSPQEVEEGVLKILIFGGSLGAEQINEGIISLISKNPNFKLKIKHQVGKDKILENIIKSENVEYEQVEYIENMEFAYKWCNVIIARAGASTISELRVVKKPCLLIPYPLATDNHQYYNATLLKEESEFYVDVIDQTLYKEALADKILKQIKFINENNLINKKINDLPRDNPNEIILKEIENVWNK